MLEFINSPEFGIKENHLIAEGNQFNLMQIGLDKADEFLRFCFKIREKDVLKSEIDRDTFIKQVEQLIKKDKDNFENSIFLAITDKKSGSIVSTLVAVKKIENKQIPTEKYFNIDLDYFCNSKNIANENIWYYTRLTVDSDFFKNNNLPYHISLAATKLLYYSIYEFAQQFFDIVFAEVTKYSHTYVNDKLGQTWTRFTDEITNEMNKELYGVFMTAAEFKIWCNQIKNDFEIL